MVLFLVIWVIIARRLAAKLQPAMMQVQQHMQSNRTELAMQTLEDMLPLSNWVPMLKGQLLAQMGMLAHYAGKKERGLELLEGASVRNGDARLLLAAIKYRGGEHDKALSILELTSKVNKKHALLHNTYAWMLHKQGRNDEAQTVLATFLKKDKDNAPAKDNLLRLQNRQKMTMQAFDMQWYALQLEQPPQAMGQMRRAPKGFREPPKRKRG